MPTPPTHTPHRAPTFAIYDCSLATSESSKTCGSAFPLPGSRFLVHTSPVPPISPSAATRPRKITKTTTSPRESCTPAYDLTTCTITSLERLFPRVSAPPSSRSGSEVPRPRSSPLRSPRAAPLAELDRTTRSIPSISRATTHEPLHPHITAEQHGLQPFRPRR
jgi:hypothetical protein